ncbi:MAG: hypothetical protein HZC18_02430 [Candidatus Omnitrophica bacterium]|nr:hypothetical protein [Candidatus Omnitrophota bacterium]
MGKVIAGLTIMFVMAGSSLVYAEPETAVPAEQPAAVPAGSSGEEVGNKVCPVSGKKVGEMGEVIKYEYNGKIYNRVMPLMNSATGFRAHRMLEVVVKGITLIYNLCCSACKKDFVKNPQEFSKIAEEEVAIAQATKVK